jgi:hypothetical protein
VLLDLPGRRIDQLIAELPANKPGQAACVSGCFPDAASAFGLMMDGTTELAPWGISPTTILNRTPGIIDLEGGTYQVLQTPGGLENAVTRSVRGIQRGNFAITYSVHTPGCGRPGGM